MRRRTVLAGALLAAGAGCTDALTEREVTFEAEPATVAEAALAETGYRTVGVTDDEVTREFDEIDRTVVVTSRVAEYARSVELAELEGELARFAVVSTPKIDVVPGRVENPVGGASNEELVATLQRKYDRIESVEADGGRTGRLGDQPVEVSRFRARARTNGERLDVFVHVAQGDSGDDFLVGVAIHPQELDESEGVDRLLKGVDHPG